MHHFVWWIRKITLWQDIIEGFAFIYTTILNSTSTVGWLDNDWLICRPKQTLTFWVNETFLDTYQQNPMSNGLTKIELRLLYKLNVYSRVTW